MIDSITEEKYDLSKLRAMFQEEFDEEEFKKLASEDGCVSREQIIHLLRCRQNNS